uniref:Membrane-bound transcription factor site-2 protease n=1 Tax=Macrostomum lignano TaxID=282301 RepID=A0A1I8JHN0_9PLAT
VNLPSNHLPYYLGALLLCGIFHEFGHAVAAAREDIRVQAAGIFVLGVYPGAFVDLNSADLALVSPARRLRVFCAGVWHNTVLALGAILLLIRPAWLLAPLGYSNASGAVVTWLAAGSVLSGQQGLYPGDVIVRVNQCPVVSPSGYYNCVAGVFAAEQQGHCLHRGLLLPAASHPPPLSSSGTDFCCRHGNASSADSDPDSASRLCFLADGGAASACLPARAVVEQQPACARASDCPAGAVCARPAVDNVSRLVSVGHDPARPALLFLGEAPELYYSLALSEFRPPALLPLWLPAAIDTGMRYIVSLSGALALLNAAPCYALDGQWILAALLDILIVGDAKLRRTVYKSVLTAGTGLLALDLLLALRYLYYY